MSNKQDHKRWRKEFNEKCPLIHWRLNRILKIFKKESLSLF